MARFDQAVWQALANQRLSDGSFFGRDNDGRYYDGFYVRGGLPVDTMWPT